MMQLRFEKPSNRPFRVLCLGAHSDDIDIGCGGAVIRLTKEYAPVSCKWIVFGADGQRAEEARTSAQAFLSGADDVSIDVRGFRDGYFPWQGDKIKDEFERLKVEFDPDIVFTHYRHDLHQDHRVISDLTWNTFRNHLILEYEIPKYDGDIGNPNFYFGFDESICRAKIDNLMTSFVSQAGKQWFTEETFRGLMRLRGIEANAPGDYAEAFYCRKANV